MPSTSTLTSNEKSLIKKHAPSAPGDKIHTAAVARVYYAFPDPAKWSYSGISGALVFGWGSQGGWIKVVDLAGTRGTIWKHEIVEEMQYYQDRTFFHTFPSDDCMIGLAFSSESEAAEMFKKVSMRSKYASKAGQSSKKSSSASAATSSPSGKKKKKGVIDKSMIGAPTGFSHVAHMGFDTEKGFSSSNVDPSWERLLGQLEGQGISRNQIIKNEAFIRNYVEGSGGPNAVASPAPPPPSGPPSRKVPPQAPASRAVQNIKRKPPAPPAPRRVPASDSFVDAAPPLPPSRAPVARPPPPPSSAPPSRSSVVPPPPPPPPPSSGPPRGAPQDGRAGLLASIQGAGVGQLRKTGADPDARAAPQIPGAGAGAAMAAGGDEDGAGGGGGADLASALAAALNQRKGKLGDSDDDDESDEDWD
ncbi:BZ3500_MvSof-1268-A1-R1_Chr4-2g07142 [Microbotryum saponariae]|uniref:BZ3500_MvSof-1268-A1-R1_Chr4-2g07142 protein n=1 Tax=Microbotryum saponariae TaxID=289078 RepID=A0A2X0NM38_9BASI|nr:BZ3500_MvSof-1268-A1-R1_Chr4-2g07142 [Microbotryum saponariae]SDA06807.1 BZ3501_MvSof-1269-A2-R1_Chr4-2g06853 [Microbotryum saponariae]